MKAKADPKEAKKILRDSFGFDEHQANRYLARTLKGTMESEFQRVRRIIEDILNGETVTELFEFNEVFATEE